MAKAHTCERTWSRAVALCCRLLSHTEMNDMGSPSKLLDQTTLATTGRMGTMGSNDMQREVRGTARKPIMDGMKPWGAKSKDKA